MITNTKTLTGEIVNISDGVVSPLADLKVNIEPVQSGSGDPSPTNVREISGRTSVKIYKTGKNLLPYPYYHTTMTQNGVTFTDNGDGSITVTGTATETTNFFIVRETQAIKFPTGQTYTLSGCPTGGSSSTYSLIAYAKRADNSNIYIMPEYGNGVSKTFEADIEDEYVATYITIRIYNGQTVNLTFHPMLRLASDSAEWESPVDNKTKSISLGRTVYGGTLNVVSGLLTVDRKYVEYDGSSDESWEVINYGYKIGLGTGNNGVTNSTKNIANWMVQADSAHNPIGSAGISGTFMIGRNFNINVSGISSITDVTTLKTYLASNPLQVVYELATPVTYQLTANEVQTLLGENNIWSDSGDVEVTYYREAISELVEEHVHVILEFTDGTTTYQCTDQTEQGSTVIDYACGTNGIEVGSCIATQLSFSLFTDDLGFGNDFNFRDFNDVTLKISNGTDTATIGSFIIDGSPRLRSKVDITALDYMTKFDKYVDMTEFITECATQPTYPELIQWCCQKCGVAYTSITGTTHRLVIYPTEEICTYRQIIGWALQCMGLIGYIDNYGRLCARFPERNIDYTPAIAGIAIAGRTIVGRTNGEVSPTYIKTFEATDRFNSDWDDEVQISGLRYTDEDGAEILVGTGDYVYDFSGNPLMDNPQLQMGLMFPNVTGRRYTIMSMETVSCPWITPMDWIIYDVDGEAKYGIVTNVTHTINGHSQIACNGEIEQSTLPMTGYGTATAVRQAEQRVNKKLTFQAEQIELKVDKDGVISAINLSEEGATINASKINLVGYVTVTDLSSEGTTVIDGGRIATGTLSADTIKGGKLTLGGANDVNGTLEILDASGNVVGTLDKDGLTTSSANITGGSFVVSNGDATRAYLSLSSGALSANIRPDRVRLARTSSLYTDVSYDGIRIYRTSDLQELAYIIGDLTNGAGEVVVWGSGSEVRINSGITITGSNSAVSVGASGITISKSGSTPRFIDYDSVGTLSYTVVSTF